MAVAANLKSRNSKRSETIPNNIKSSVQLQHTLKAAAVLKIANRLRTGMCECDHENFSCNPWVLTNRESVYRPKRNDLTNEIRGVVIRQLRKSSAFIGNFIKINGLECEVLNYEVTGNEMTI
ncbi:hypothetical protein TNCV_427301 [Trichonephila clavipes]|nr:hypothetical protein TNCV_427301 [Trichonephila clavipes]